MSAPPEDAIDRQIQAYNARDIAAFAACYADGIVILDGDGNELLRGREALHARYRSLFEASPDLHAEVTTRLRIGRFVVDEERVTGSPQGDVRAIAVYRLGDDGLIDRVQFLG